jgi:hypothetical protein
VVVAVSVATLPERAPVNRSSMLDVLVPIPLANAALAVDAIKSIRENTDLAFRLVVILDGGIRSDYAQLESFMAGYEGQWKMLHNKHPVHLNQTLREGLEECDAKITAIIAPQVRLQDPQWFGKAQVIFHRDPVVGIVDTEPNTKSATLHPVRRANTNPAAPGCPFAIVQTAFARKTQPFGDVDAVSFWSRYVMANGGSSWAAPGIRYFLTEHKEHERWRAPSGSLSQSG